MFTKTLLPDTLRALQLVSSIPEIKESYLAGGTALALRLGHRLSVDLDFFTKKEFDEEKVKLELENLGNYKHLSNSWQTVLGVVGQTKFSIFNYKYPILDDFDVFENINIASLKDIAAMKLLVVSDRGAKRDFIDLYFLNQEFTFDQILSFYDQKYGNLRERMYHIARSLDYFDDADQDRDYKMLIEVSWDDIKKHFRRIASNLI